jgi:hypothetical protein
MLRLKNLYPLFIVIALIFHVRIFAQAENKSIVHDVLELPRGLGLSNQMEYSYDVHLKKEILENWFNMDYRSGIFSSGIRFDVFQPNDPEEVWQ